jgi:2-dehydropantoate 2-reductase
MRIAILGSGGVGGYFGGRLAAAGGVDVHFIARGEHLAALQSRGLTIESPSGNLHVPKVDATSDPATIGPVDLVFFAVKLYDTENAIAMLPPLIGPKTLVIPFQNGVDSVDRLVRAIGREHVAGGTTYVTATIAAPGVIRHTALDRLVFGPIAGEAPSSLEELYTLTTRAGIEGVLAEKIQTEIWKKFVRLSVFSGITATLRSPIGPIREDAELRAMIETALHETIAVARGKQVPVPHDMFNEALAGLDAMPRHAKSSMLQDLERGRPLELPWLSGGVVRIGREVGVPTPTHEMFVRLLRLHVNGAPQ